MSFDRPPRMRKKRRFKMRPTPAGMIATVLLILLAFGCYTKFANPFASHFTLNATFGNANGLLPGSPVRVAGVNVGKVTGVHSLGNGSQAAVVSMEVDSAALPVHDDATFSIRPRIFLEGNFFVDLFPGTPGTPDVQSGHQFPISAGTEPVQLDQLLTSLQSSTRKNLQVVIQQYGLAVKQSGPSYHASIKYWLPAYKYSSIVSHDFLGEDSQDIPTLFTKGAEVSAATDSDPPALQSLITNLDSFAGALAVQRNNLAAAIHELPTTLATANPTLTAVDHALPPLNRFANALLPGVKSTPATVNASLPLITQLRGLVQPAELTGFSKTLTKVIPSLGSLTKSSIPLFAKEVRPASSCVVNEIYPWSQTSIDDGVFTNKPGFPERKVFQEAVDYLPGLGAESRNIDANGPYIRVLLSGGSATYSLSPGLFGQSASSITSVQPALPPNGTRPPLHPGTPCETQPAITQAGIQAPIGAPISQVNSNLDAPGAKLRWVSAVVGAIDEIKAETKQQGGTVTLDPKLVSGLQSELAQALVGTPNAAGVLTKTLNSIGIAK